ncbi:MAG: hypothetical protein ABIY52_02785, partial [Gemmatimonadaceae bacterium]
QLPFLDSDFLAIIASVPLEQRLYHAFYNEWLAHFPSYVSATRWQAYPGHVPCPVPSDDTLVYQWDKTGKRRPSLRARRRTTQRAWASLMATGLANPMLRTHAFVAVTMMHLTGLRNYDYAVSTAVMLQRRWRVCRASGGGVVASPVTRRPTPIGSHQAVH